jgi:hypothetical protein
MDKRLLIFAILYTTITVYFFNDMIRTQGGASLGYISTFPKFWILAAIVLGLLIWLGKIKIKGWNILGLIFSTPVPVYLFALIFFQPKNLQLAHISTIKRTSAKRSDLQKKNRILVKLWYSDRGKSISGHGQLSFRQHKIF